MGHNAEFYGTFEATTALHSRSNSMKVEPRSPGSQFSAQRSISAEEAAGIETAWQRLLVAVNYLAAGSGTIQYRLECAFIRCIRPLLRSHIPESVRTELEEILTLLAAGADVEADRAVRESIARVPEPDAKEAARRIVSLFNHVARAHPYKG